MDNPEFSTYSDLNPGGITNYCNMYHSVTQGLPVQYTNDSDFCEMICK